MAAETAVGVDPVGAVDVVLRCISAFERTHFRASPRIARNATAGDERLPGLSAGARFTVLSTVLRG